MLQVQKKKKHGGTKGLWAAALLTLLLAGSISVYLLLENQTEQNPTRTYTRGTLLSKEKGSVSRINIQVRDREAWTAVRDTEGKLKIESREGLSIDKTLGERIEDALENLIYEDILSDDPKEYRDRLAEFGLDNPEMIVTATYSDGTEITVRIGDNSGLEDSDFRFMILDGDDRLFAVSESMVEDLGIEKELLYPVEQPDIQISRLDRIRILNGMEEVQAEWVLNSVITDAEAEASWILHTEKITYPADQNQIINLKKNVGNLRLGFYVSEKESSDLSAYGLDTPYRIIEVHMAAGRSENITEEGIYQLIDRPEETRRFIIGSSRNEMTDFVLYGDKIYTINHFSVAALTELNPVNTISRYLVTVPTENISSLTIDRDDGTHNEYTLTYIVETGDEDDPGKTIIECKKDGEPFSNETFAAAYERWRVATVSGQLPEDWKKQKSNIIYTIKTLSGELHTVELSPFDAMHEAVTIDGWTLFYIIKNGLEPLL